MTAEAAADPPVRPGCEARIVWHGAAEGRPKAKTDLSVVYIHGFSASPEETRPVPDRVAEALGANLYFARLTGHGQGGAAMGRATLAAWQTDVKNALQIGRGIGRKVLVMGCSTGSTVATLAALDAVDLAGVIHMAPNFAMASRLTQWLIDAPGVGRWGPWIMGAERVIEPINDAHTQYWATRYPTNAVIPLAEAVRAVRKANLGRITVPALFLYCEEDKIVSPAAIRAVAARWGGKTAEHVVTMGPGDDANGHVIAGDVFSPGQTDGVVQVMLDWAERAL